MNPFGGVYFFDFFLICQIFVLDICVYLDFLGVEVTLGKFGNFWVNIHGEILCQRLATFDPIFSCPTCALTGLFLKIFIFEGVFIYFLKTFPRVFLLLLFCSNLSEGVEASPPKAF